jgi:hypothetical protein
MPKTIHSSLLGPIAALLAGCTHVSTLPDTARTENGHALRGVSYSLPMLQYEIEIDRGLASCPSELTLDFGRGEKVSISDEALAFSTVGEAKPRYVPGEQYVVNYDSLTSMLKTTGFAIEPYASGALKTINLSADDKSGEIVKDLIKVGLTVASAAAGAPGVGAAIAAVPTSGSVNLNAAFSLRRETREQRAARLARTAAEDLRGRLRPLSIVDCTEAAAGTLKKIAKNSGDQEAVAAKLPKLTLEVERLIVVAGLKAADHDDAAALAAAMAALNEQLLEAERLTAEGAELEAKTQVTTARSWPRLPSDRSTEDELKENDLKGLARLLRVKTVSTLTLEEFEAWLAGAGAPVAADLRKTNEAFFAHFDDLKAARERGTQRTVDGICRGGTPNVQRCVSESTLVRAAIEQAEVGYPTCTAEGAKAPYCTNAVALDAKQRLVRDAMDGVADKGIFVRPPVEGIFTLCRARREAEGEEASFACVEGPKLVRLVNASVPQLGQLRFLPFRSRPFESAELALHLREDGSIEKLEYKRPRPMGAGLAAAAGDAAGQYRTYVETRRADRKAAREEEIAQLQYQLDLAEKKKALLKAQTPETETEDEALATELKNEIAKIELRTKYLEAQIAQKKAEAAAAEAGVVQLSAS